MKSGTLIRGMQLSYKGIHYIVVNKLSSGEYQLQNIKRGNFIPMSALDVAHNMFTGDLCILVGDEKKHINDVDDINLLPDDAIKEAEKRKIYVENALRDTFEERTRNGLQNSTNATAEEIIDRKKPPSISTLYRWINSYLKNDKSIKSLIPKRCLIKGLSRIDKRVQKIIDTSYKDYYLTLEKPTVEALYKKICSDIFEKNKKIEVAEKMLPLPSIRTVYRRVSEASEYEKMLNREGEKTAIAKFLVGKHFKPPTRILERVEMDHTKLDVMVVHDENFKLLGRPWITIAIDVFSRSICGFYVSFEDPSIHNAMECLIHCIMPKKYVKKKYQMIKNPWDNYGMPEVVVCDNGDGFQSESMARACSDVGIHLLLSPPGYAWERGTIERFNGTLNTELIHLLPGTTRSNIAEKNEYNSKKHAGIKFSTLIKAIHIYIIDDYHQDFHEGIKDYPNEVWTLGAKKYEPRPFPKPEKLPSLMARIERRDLTNRGILFKYLRYNCDELIELFKEYGKIQVEFKFISSDMSKIYVVHPEKHTFIPTPALDQDYTKDLSLWQHQKAIDLNNEKRRRRNLEGIVKANKEIRDAVAHDIQEFSEYTAKMAKWKRIRQDNSTDGSGHSGQKKDEKEVAAKTVEKIPEKNARNPKKPNNESKSNTKRKTVNKPKKSQKPTLPQPPIPRRKAPIVAPSDIDGWSFDYRDRI